MASSDDESSTGTEWHDTSYSGPMRRSTPNTSMENLEAHFQSAGPGQSLSDNSSQEDTEIFFHSEGPRQLLSGRSHSGETTANTSTNNLLLVSASHTDGEGAPCTSNMGDGQAECAPHTSEERAPCTPHTGDGLAEYSPPENNTQPASDPAVLAGLQALLTMVTTGNADVQNNFREVNRNLQDVQENFTDVRDTMENMHEAFQHKLKETQEEIGLVHKHLADIRSQAEVNKVIMDDRFSTMERRLGSLGKVQRAHRQPGYPLSHQSAAELETGVYAPPGYTSDPDIPGKGPPPEGANGYGETVVKQEASSLGERAGRRPGKGNDDGDGDDDTDRSNGTDRSQGHRRREDYSRERRPRAQRHMPRANFPSFDGTADNYAGFLQQFELTSRILDTPEEEKGFRLLTTLKGKAARAMENFDITGEISYEDVRRAMDSLYRRKKDTEFWLALLNKCRLDDFDNVDDYGREITRLVGHAYISVPQEGQASWLKHHFVNGIPGQYHAALISAKCESNTERVHIVEQLQRLGSAATTETANWTRVSGTPSDRVTPQPTQMPLAPTTPLVEEMKSLKIQVDTLSQLVSPALMATAAALNSTTFPPQSYQQGSSRGRGGYRGRGQGRGGWNNHGSRGGANAKGTANNEKAPGADKKPAAKDASTEASAHLNGQRATPTAPGVSPK